jgi:TIR domain
MPGRLQGKKMSGQIFISYRREESRWLAKSLHFRLCRDFAPEQIFMDIDAIALGEDFVRAIETTVAKCDVLIAVIGANWLDAKDRRGLRRLDNPEDYVRMEIGTALRREIRVIPVLVDGALMPRSTDLPEDLRPLVRRNALSITDTSFEGDCQRLVTAMKVDLEKAAAEEQRRLEAERHQREEKERLESEQREKQRLEAQRLEKERLEAERQERSRQEAETLAAQQRENERLVNERREKDRLEAERLKAERQRRLAASVQAREERERLGSEHGQSKGNRLPASQDPEAAQPETPPIVQGKGSTKQKLPTRVVLVVSALILIVGLLWFAGSKLNHGGREAALATPTPVAMAISMPNLTPSPAAAAKRGDSNDVASLMQVQKDIEEVETQMKVLKAKAADLKERLASISKGDGNSNAFKLSQDLARQYLPADPQIQATLSDPSLSPEDKMTLTLMAVMNKLDADIADQAQRTNALQSSSSSNQSIDVEAMKLKRMIDKRSQMFDMLRQIIDKYNQTAKGIIDSMRN